MFKLISIVALLFGLYFLYQMRVSLNRIKQLDKEEADLLKENESLRAFYKQYNLKPCDGSSLSYGFYGMCILYLFVVGVILFV